MEPLAENATMSDTRKWHVIEVIIISIAFSLLFIFLTRYLDYSRMWVFGDLIAFPTDIQLYFERLFYAWSSEGLGITRSPMLNISFVNSSLSTVFGGLIAQKISFVSALPISALSCYMLLRYFRFSTITAILGALLYSINPVTVSAFSAGGTGQLMTFAIFPILIIYIHKLISQDKFDFKNIAIVGIASLLLWNLYVGFWYGLLIVVPMILFGTVFARKTKRLTRLLPLMAILTLVFIPSILILFSMGKEITGDDVSFLADALYIYQDSSFANVIRLAGNTGSPQASLGYNIINDYSILGVFLSVTAITGILFLRNATLFNPATIVILSSMVCLVTASGLIILMKEYPYLVDSNPIMSSLRNPEKLLYPLAFSFTILIAFGIEQFIRKFRTELIRFTFLLFMLFTILFYNYPALDGTFGLENVRKGFYVDDKYHQLPRVLSGIDSSYKEHRFLMLPWEYEGSLRIKSEAYNYFGTPLGSEISGVNIQQIKNIFDIINSNQQNRADVMALFDIKYVVVDKTFGEEISISKRWVDQLKQSRDSVVYNDGQAWWLTGDPAHFYSSFNSDSKFQLVYDGTDFAVFKNNIEMSKLYAVSTPELAKIVNSPSLGTLVSTELQYEFNYERINPTQYRLTTSSSGPFALVFAETYNPYWEARVYSKNGLTTVRPTALAGTINLFQINETGDLDIVITNTQQGTFEIALMIVALIYAFCIIYLIFGKQLVNRWFTRFNAIVSRVSSPIVWISKVLPSNGFMRRNEQAPLISKREASHTPSRIVFLVAYFLAISVLAYFLVQNDNELYLLIVPVTSVPFIVANRLLGKLIVIYSIALLLISVYVMAIHGSQMVANRLSILSYLMLLWGVAYIIIEYFRDRKLQLTTSTIKV